MRSKATALACVVLCCGLLPGCLILPIPVPRSSGPVAGSRAEVSNTLPEQVKAGETTRTDVLLLLGEPDGRGGQDRWFTYGSRVGRGGVGWDLLWMVGAGYGGTAGTIKLDDWEKVRRATIQFDAAGVVSKVAFEEYHCSIGKGGCTDIRGSDMGSREKAAERAAHRTSAGAILAEYDLYTWITNSGSDCQQLRVSPGAVTSTGHELLIAEHGIVRTEKDLPAGAAEPYSSLSYDDIASVLPIEQETGHQWIPLRTRSGSCVYLELLQPGPGALSPDQARALILARLTPPSAPTISGREP